jgi:ubiquinone/menaquinone biosynthesis C-methylase UbiE
MKRTTRSFAETVIVAEPLTRIEEECLLEFLKVGKGDRVLDIGTGSGRLASKVIAIGATVVGLDFTPGALKSARDYLPHERFHSVLSDLDVGIPFEDGVFDAAFCVRVLKYLSSPAQLIKEVFRVLRTGGTFVLEFSNLYSWEHAYYRLRRQSPWKFFRKGEVCEMLKLAGFRLGESRPLHKVPSPLYALDPVMRRLTPEQFLSRGIMLQGKKEESQQYSR